MRNPDTSKRGLTRDLVEAEVRRLAPWYYLLDLDGVRTDIAPPCDHRGHRQVRLPSGAELFLRGKTVLDAGCNEGGYSFAALECGAREVHGFDCRPINVQKATFAASVNGRDNSFFEVGDADSWVSAHGGARHDYVFLCGLLYHLPRPWETIGNYCAVANEGIFVACVLAGGADGYTPLAEKEHIASSSNPAELSMMPNTTRTLRREFERHHFHPLFLSESRDEDFWGACWLLLRNCSNVGPGRRPVTIRRDKDDVVDMSVVPLDDRGKAWQVVLYNWTDRELALAGRLTIKDRQGSILRSSGPELLALPPRMAGGSASSSLSVGFGLDAEDLEGLQIEATAEDPVTKECLGRAVVSLAGQEPLRT